MIEDMYNNIQNVNKNNQSLKFNQEYYLQVLFDNNRDLYSKF